MVPVRHDDWRSHATLFATDHAKVLIRDNPGLEPGQRAAQAERRAKVSEWAAANDRALIVEVLVPPSPADLAAAGGNAATYDATLRPEHTVQVIEDLQDHGGGPGLWGGGGRPPPPPTTRSRAPRPSSAAGDPPAASSSAGTRARTSLTTGCRSRPRFPASLASPSAAASGGTRCTPTCITAALPRGPGSGSPPPTSTSCVTSSTHARGRSRCTTSPIPRSSIHGRRWATAGVTSERLLSATAPVTP